MILVDANLLLYAYDSTSPWNVPARAWLEAALHGGEGVRFALVTLLAFIRIATNPSIYERPLSSLQAIDIVSSLLQWPACGIAQPTPRHWSVLADVAASGQARGPLVMDAHLASLAIEHGATLYTTDRDFARFPNVRLKNPLEGL